jgi:hypothetical protein
MLAPVELVSMLICLRMDHSSFHHAFALAVNTIVAASGARTNRTNRLPADARADENL